MSLVAKTIQALRPGAQWSLVGENIEWVKLSNGEYETPNFEWFDTTQEKPTKEEYEAEYAVQVELKNAQQYKFFRRREYPSIQELADAIYWQAQGDNSKMEAYLAAVEAVKNKYPKGV